MKPGQRPTVSLEDLLRLKRSERPSPEFWSDFDRRLREKQLAALVEKRPWWRELGTNNLWSGLRRYHLPLGATAVIAVTVASFQLHRSEVQTEMANPGSLDAVAMTQAGDAMVAIATERLPEDVGPAPRETLATSASASGPASVPDLASPPPSGEIIASKLPLTGMGAAEDDGFHASWNSRGAEATLVSVRAGEPFVSGTLLSTNSRFEARAMPPKPAVEPLQQITPPSERRGSRILAAMVSMSTVENAMRTTERAANRLSEERLYDQIHRFGARGAGVSVKF